MNIKLCMFRCFRGISWRTLVEEEEEEEEAVYAVN